MATLLVVDSSPRGARSRTRTLTRLFAQRWREAHPSDLIVERDLGAAPPSPVDERWIAAAFTSPAERTEEMRRALAASDALIDELQGADVVAIGAPMYNFGMPAALKAWVDQVVRVGRTFSFDPADTLSPYRPLLRGKTAVVLTARGDAGYGPGGRLAALNHLDPHLATVLRFIGIDRIETVAVEFDEFGDDRVRRSMERARADVEALVARLAAERAAGEPRPAP
jgi:FMN-dependent NADH-azoreductase